MFKTILTVYVKLTLLQCKIVSKHNLWNFDKNNLTVVFIPFPTSFCWTGSTEIWIIADGLSLLSMSHISNKLVKVLKNDENSRRMGFYNQMVQMMEDNENFSSLLIFSDEANFQLSGKVNQHNVQILGYWKSSRHFSAWKRFP